MMLTLRFNQLGDAWTAAGRIGQVLAAAPPPAGGDAALPPDGELRAEGLAKMHLSWPDLTVAPGEFVAVTGAVGTGKTTLLRLLGGLEDPDRGTVSLGGADLRNAPADRVRDVITLVGQRPLLLSGTIADNLRLGRDLSDEQLRDACRRAAILDHVESLPEGFGTVVGERGSTLSGGQMQRLALARGLLRGARVLLLDDVTSAVDADTERRILDGLPELTIVAVTSRPPVAARADRVVELSPVRDGELIGRG
jgi:ATP-binding cassette subfamily B protein